MITILQTDSGDQATRIGVLETWQSTHATEYSNLNSAVAGLSADLGTRVAPEKTAFEWLRAHDNTVTSHNTRIGSLEGWKRTHEGEYGALANRVTALETWKGTHSTEYTNLSKTVSDNSDAIDALTLVLTWGTF